MTRTRLEVLTPGTVPKEQPGDVGDRSHAVFLEDLQIVVAGRRTVTVWGTDQPNHRLMKRSFAEYTAQPHRL